MRLAIVVLGLLLVGHPLAAAEFFVSPTGTDGGNGSQKSPWSLAKALSHPGGVKPGDTIWLRGGTYTGNFTSHLKGTARAPIVVRQYPGERATLDGNVNPAVRGDGKPVLAVQDGAFTWFWGFEVMNSNPERSNPVSGSHPIDARGYGIFITAAGTKIINVVVHDTGQGISCGPAAKDVELYGNIIYFNGWTAPDRGHGHGIYVQNYEGGSKLIKHNVLFNGFSYNLHAYGSSAAGFVNSTVEENVWFLGVTLIGGLSGFSISGTQVTGNYSWGSPTAVGYFSKNCNAMTVSGNYFVNVGHSSAYTPPTDPLCRAAFSLRSNTIVGDLDGFKAADYPNNTYYSKTSPPTQDKLTVLSNAYEAGRATIVVYNWDGSATQAVDLTGVVAPGAAYEIRNVQNFYGPPVVSGTYAGGTVTLPMTGLTPATPIGYEARPPTGPAFNVFVVMPTHTAAGTPSKGQQEQQRTRKVQNQGSQNLARVLLP